MNLTWWNRLLSTGTEGWKREAKAALTLERLEERCLLDASGFRPIDEVGNNTVNNADWGAAPADQAGGAAIQLLRFSAVAYADGISKASMGGGSPTFIASPRTVSNDVDNQATTLFGSTDVNTVDQNGLSDFGYTWGQFLDHDLDLTPDGGATFNIPADPTHTATSPPADPITNLDFTRSQTDPNTGTSTTNPLQQINVNTSFMDLSQVYGSSQFVADALRTGTGGMMKTSPGADGIVGTADDLLPYNNTTYFTQDQLNALHMANDAGLVTSDKLFAAGDRRANENLELTALQTLFVRNHNLIASELAQQNPSKFGFTSWTDENLYQEARKLNIAEEQMITYNYYLPDLLGPDALPAYNGYDSGVNASIATEFSTIGFRFGHSLLNNTVARDNNNGSPIGTSVLQLSQDFFDPNLLAPGGVTDPFTGLLSTDIGNVLKGDADNSAQAMDVMAVNSVRNLLFGDGSGGGQDLIARDIWRAHDDGIGTYNQLRAYYNSIFHNLPPIAGDANDPQGFDQITSNTAVQQALATAYNSKAGFQSSGKTAGDIDPFEAGIAEDHAPGSDLGPLFTDILVDQFTRLRDGDRFFYLNESFTQGELSILGQGNTLAKIIEGNTSITKLQDDVFINLSQENGQGHAFYANNKGQTALTGTPNGTTLLTSVYNSLVAALDPNNTGYLALVDANGNHLSDTFLQSYSNVENFLTNTSTSVAFKLSRQLLTAEINVALGKVDPTTSIYVPAVGSLSSGQQASLQTNGVSNTTGIAGIQSILNAAIGQLNSSTPDTDLEKALKECLAAINNNDTIFIL